MGRKVLVDVNELIDILYADKDCGNAASSLEYLMKSSLKITKEDLLSYAEYYNTDEARSHGYEEEDYECAVSWVNKWVEEEGLK